MGRETCCGGGLVLAGDGEVRSEGVGAQAEDSLIEEVHGLPGALPLCDSERAR